LVVLKACVNISEKKDNNMTHSFMQELFSPLCRLIFLIVVYVVPVGVGLDLGDNVIPSHIVVEALAFDNLNVRKRMTAMNTILPGNVNSAKVAFNVAATSFWRNSVLYS
jgi:hypothetical protein